MSGEVLVSGETPTLTFNDRGQAVYNAVASSGPNMLASDYTVGHPLTSTM
jgi:hypothetical protein